MITPLVDILPQFKQLEEKNVEGMVCSFKNLLSVQSLETQCKYLCCGERRYKWAGVFIVKRIISSPSRESSITMYFLLREVTLVSHISLSASVQK